MRSQMGSIVISTCSWFKVKVYVYHVLCAKFFNVSFVLGDIGLRLSYCGVQWQVDHNGECNKKCYRSILHYVHWAFEVHMQWLIVDQLKWICTRHDQHFNWALHFLYRFCFFVFVEHLCCIGVLRNQCKDSQKTSIKFYAFFFPFVFSRLLNVFVALGFHKQCRI
jgi:hypothetical protein